MAIAGFAFAAIPARGAGPGLPASVHDYEPPIRTESYRFTDLGRSPSPRDDKTGTARFRVVERTGNCCENYVTIAPDGRLFDLGGRYINFTTDDGRSWKQVRPAVPLVNGEGTISVAPGGDIVGVEWDPYSGDHLLSYKFDAATKQWQYLEMPLHTPFYDRPWLTVVPGRFRIDDDDVSYVVFVDGYPHRGPLLYSTDGLTYTQMSNPFIDQRLRPAHESWLKTTRDRALDWVLPNSQSPITALGGGSALAAPGPFADSWAIFDPDDHSWSALRLPDGKELEGRVLVDSKRRIHNVITRGSRFEYRISANGARSWTTTTVELPAGHSPAGSMQVDFRVNASVGLAVVGIHARTDDADRDLLYKLDISSNKARPTRLYEIGAGDIDASAGVGRDIRFDFETVAIFPDGRVAVSFLDSTTGPTYHLTEAVRDRLGPALAIEL